MSQQKFKQKSLAIKLFLFCDLKTQQRYILQEEVNISKRCFSSLVDSLRDFLKTFDEFYTSVYILETPNTKLNLDLQSEKTTSLLLTLQISLNIKIDVFVFHCDFKTTILASFPSESLNYKVIYSYLQKVSTLIMTKFTTLTGTNITMQTNVEKFRAITIFSTFTLDCRCDNSIIEYIGNAFCANTMCSEKLRVHINIFHSLGRSIWQCLQCTSQCLVRKSSFEKRTNSVFLKLHQKVYIFEGTQKSIQDVIGDVYCPGRFCSLQRCVHDYTREKMMKTVNSLCNANRAGRFKEQKLENTLFGIDGTYWFVKRTRRDYKNEKLSPILEKFVRQSQSATHEYEKKSKNRSICSLILSTRHWLIQQTKKSFTFSFRTLPAYSKTT